MDVDWLGALIGAVAGAALTAVGGYVAYRFERSRIEKNALLELERSLNERRAFRVDGVRIVPGAAQSDDFDRLNRSVISARTLIGGTRAALIRHQDAQEQLTRMIRACNLYLEASAREPSRYYAFAADLRDELHARLREMSGKGDATLRPGDGAFPAAPVGGRP